MYRQTDGRGRRKGIRQMDIREITRSGIAFGFVVVVLQCIVCRVFLPFPTCFFLLSKHILLSLISSPACTP